MRIRYRSSDVVSSDLVASLDKILAATRGGQSIPEDWGLHSEGQPTTDPAAVKTLMRMSGAKGSGLSLMIEILASLAAGNAVLVPALAGAKGTRMNGVAIALDVAMLGEPGAFAASVEIGRAHV